MAAFAVSLLSVLPVSLLMAAEEPSESYTWTTDHMQVGVRWQPFAGRPANNAYDGTRPVIAEDNSYAQFWVAWMQRSLPRRTRIMRTICPAICSH